jgi:hypothetical protein
VQESEVLDSDNEMAAQILCLPASTCADGTTDSCGYRVNVAGNTVIHGTSMRLKLSYNVKFEMTLPAAKNPLFLECFCTSLEFLELSLGGGNADLPQNSLKARAPRNSLIINAEVISHNHFPTTRPEKRFSPLISRHRTRVTGLQ